MYESASGERFTLYTSRAETGTTQMRYASHDNDGALFWADRGVGYVLSGPTDKDRLNQVARLVYDQTEKSRKKRMELNRDSTSRAPIRTLKIWNWNIGASQYRTG